MSDEMEVSGDGVLDSSPEAAGTPESRQSAIDKRIGRVVAQRQDALSRLDAVRNENAELKAMIAQTQGQMAAFLEQQQASTGPKTIERFSEDEIVSMIQEQGITDPSVLSKGVRELARREAQAALGTARSEFTASQARERALQETNQSILADFGPSAVQPDSELSKRASKIATRVVGQIHALDPKLAEKLFDQAPQLAWLVYAAAAGSGGAQAAASAQTELEVLQERNRSDAAVLSPAQQEAEASAARRKAVSNGDWRGGLLQLPSLRALKRARAVRAE